jgi:hypothetical protein
MSKQAVPPEADAYLLDMYQREVAAAHHNRDFEARDFYTEEIEALGHENYPRWQPKKRRYRSRGRTSDASPSRMQNLSTPGVKRETFIGKDGELHENAPVVTPKR